MFILQFDLFECVCKAASKQTLQKLVF